MTRIALAVLTLVFGVACKIGGLNTNQRHEGNRAGGIGVGEHEIAVQPNGQRVIARVGGALYVGTVATGQLARVDGLAEPRKLAFWANGHGVFVLTARELASYDMAGARIVWRRSIAPEVERLDVTSDGARLVATGTDVAMIDALTGADVGRWRPANKVEDVDITPDGSRVIVTEKETWRDGTPATTIDVLAAATGERLCATSVPNCADELVLAPDGAKAYLAPTACRKDPVSIIDVTRDCKFEKNLPGFGPVALTPDGALGVAFIDKRAMDPTAPPRPPEVDLVPDRYHLMTFDTTTHALRTLPIGDTVPRYAITPDGAMLVVDHVERLAETEKQRAYTLMPGPVRIVDVTSLGVREATGPAAMLDAYVVSPDSREIWMLHHNTYRIENNKIVRSPDGELFHLDLGAGVVERLELPFTPHSLNSLPGTQTLLLRDATKLYLYDTAQRRVVSTLAP